VTAVVLLALVVYPYDGSHRQNDWYKVAFFGHVARFDDPASFGDALDAVESTRRGHIVEQAWVVSRLVQRKYVLMRWSFHAIGAAVGLQATALALNLLL
jgi:Family of unknown function (DUF5706)